MESIRRAVWVSGRDGNRWRIRQDSARRPDVASRIHILAAQSFRSHLAETADRPFCFVGGFGHGRLADGLHKPD